MKTKTKIFTVLFILVVLIGSFFAGDDFPNPPDNNNLNLVASQQKSTEEIPETLNEQPPKDELTTENEEPQISNKPSDHIEIPESVDKTPAENQPVFVNPNDENEILQDENPVDDGHLYCTLSVNCSSVFENYERLKEAKREIIPKDGVILKETMVEFFQGESVFDVLNRELRNRKIHIDFVSNPMYNSVYIKGIANLYEFDCGELSGWFYKVNGEKPNFGCSQYKLKDKDNVEFYYTCNMFE